MKRLRTALLLACILAVLCLGSCIYEADKKIAPPPDRIRRINKN